MNVLFSKLSKFLFHSLIVMFIFFNFLWAQDHVAFLTSSSDYGQTWTTPKFIPQPHLFNTAKLSDVIRGRSFILMNYQIVT